MATHGFYYDEQKKNKKTAITLHANTQKNSNGDWDDWAGETFPLNSGGGPAYGVDPICSGILNEDFGISISNNWGEADLGNAIQDFWNQGLRPFAPYAKEIGKVLDDIEANKSENKEESWAVNLFQKGVDVASDVADFATKHLNWALVVQGFRFTYFNGGSTNFKNLNMRFTLFPDWVDGKLVTVHQQIEKFLPYCISQYQTFDKKDLESIKSLPDSGKDLIASYAAWQKPPGGFEAGTKSVDIVQKGTLRLNVGLSYCIENLVISECNIEFSKVMAKYPENDSIKMTPLYAEVSLQLQPASMFTDNMFKKFTSGDDTNPIVQKEEEDLNKKMKEQLEQTKNK